MGPGSKAGTTLRDIMRSRSRGVLDTPLAPVIVLAEGETRWRGMTGGGCSCCDDRPISKRQRRRCGVEPDLRRLVDMRAHGMADALVIIVEPGEFIAPQHAEIDQPAVDRRQRHAPE